MDRDFLLHKRTAGWLDVARQFHQQAGRELSANGWFVAANFGNIWRIGPVGKVETAGSQTRKANKQKSGDEGKIGMIYMRSWLA